MLQGGNLIMEKLIIPLIVIGVIFTILKVISEKVKPKKEFSYTKKQYLLTKNESEFLRSLYSILGNTYYIFPQVHLSSFLDQKVKGQNWKAALSHIDRKSVDYLICEKQNVSPILAIELDDRSHEREDRILRDEEVERIFTEVNLPLIRGDKETIEKKIKEHLLS